MLDVGEHPGHTLLWYFVDNRSQASILPVMPHHLKGCLGTSEQPQTDARHKGRRRSTLGWCLGSFEDSCLLLLFQKNKETQNKRNLGSTCMGQDHSYFSFFLFFSFFKTLGVLYTRLQRTSSLSSWFPRGKIKVAQNESVSKPHKAAYFNLADLRRKGKTGKRERRQEHALWASQ